MTRVGACMIPNWRAMSGFFSASMKRMKQDLVDVCSTSFGPEDRAIRGSDQDRIEVVIPLMRNYCNQYTNKFKSKPVGVNYQPASFDGLIGQEALVQLADGVPAGAATAESIVAEAARHLARYKLPKDVLFRERLLRSPSGKADYRWAREQALADG